MFVGFFRRTYVNTRKESGRNVTHLDDSGKIVGRSRKGGGLGTAIEKSSKGALFGTFNFFL